MSDASCRSTPPNAPGTAHVTARDTPLTGSSSKVQRCTTSNRKPASTSAQHRSVPSERIALSWDGVAVGNWRFRRSLRAVPGVRLILSETRLGAAHDAADCGSGSTPTALDDVPPVLARALAVFERLGLRPEEPSLVEELQSLLASGDQLDLESKHA